MFCSKCGQKCDDDAQFCKNCGYDLTQGEEPKGEVKKNKTKKQIKKSDIEAAPPVPYCTAAGRDSTMNRIARKQLVPWQFCLICTQSVQQ